MQQWIYLKSTYWMFKSSFHIFSSRQRTAERLNMIDTINDDIVEISCVMPLTLTGRHNRNDFTFTRRSVVVRSSIKPLGSKPSTELWTDTDSNID